MKCYTNFPSNQLHQLKNAGIDFLINGKIKQGKYFLPNFYAVDGIAETFTNRICLN